MLWLSRIAARFSDHNIVVEKSFLFTLRQAHKSSLVSCGVDFTTFFETGWQEARAALGYQPGELLVLFSSSFDNPVKNYPLAKKATELAKTKPFLVELKNHSRERVNLLMNAADALLVTSFTEGAPLVVREALTCRLPVISTPVGDVPDLAQQTDGISIAPFDPQYIADELDRLLAIRKRVKLNSIIKSFDNKEIATRVKAIYERTIKKDD